MVTVKIISSRLAERQGGVSTYVGAMEALLPVYGLNVVRDGDCDILLHVGPHYYNGIELSNNKKNVIVVHDIIPELLWHDEFVRKERLRALQSAHSVIAVSEWTKNDLIREYGIDSKNIHVIHHGAGRVGDESPLDAEVSIPFKSGSYFLYVGKRNDYKRFKWLLYAIAPIMWKFPRLRLLCTGDAFCRREWALITLLGLLGRIKTHRFEDSEMASVYSNSLVLMYPSVYEGFGLPILEAMRAKCPVMASRSTCIPEVAGDAAAYYLEGDVKDFRRKVIALIGKEARCQTYRRDLIDRGWRRSQLFSWHECARLTARVLLNDCNGVK